jgi:hypothetical protein
MISIKSMHPRITIVSCISIHYIYEFRRLLLRGEFRHAYTLSVMIRDNGKGIRARTKAFFGLKGKILNHAFIL